MAAPPKQSDLHARLGYRPLSRTWAKAEILLGLGASGAGLLASIWGLSQAAIEWPMVCGGWGLFVLGAYLALAGHRSHLYQSANEQASYLADIIRQRE